MFALSRRRNALRLGIAAGALAALITSAPAQDQKPAEAPAAAAPAAPAAKPDPNAVVATVAGQPVTEADIDLAIQNLDQQFAQLPPEQKRAAAPFGHHRNPSDGGGSDQQGSG
jgi:peptidyl-prolyl cis-trans isomerase C